MAPDLPPIWDGLLLCDFVGVFFSLDAHQPSSVVFRSTTHPGTDFCYFSTISGVRLWWVVAFMFLRPPNRILLRRRRRRRRSVTSSDDVISVVPRGSIPQSSFLWRRAIVTDRRSILGRRAAPAIDFGTVARRYVLIAVALYGDFDIVEESRRVAMESLANEHKHGRYESQRATKSSIQ